MPRALTRTVSLDLELHCSQLYSGIFKWWLGNFGSATPCVGSWFGFSFNIQSGFKGAGFQRFPRKAPSPAQWVQKNTRPISPPQHEDLCRCLDGIQPAPPTHQRCWRWWLSWQPWTHRGQGAIVVAVHQNFRPCIPSFGFSYSTPCTSGIWVGSSNHFDAWFQPNCGKPCPIPKLQLGTNHPSKRALLLVTPQQVGLPVNLQAPRSTAGPVVLPSLQSQHLETVGFVAAQRQHEKRGRATCELGPVGSTCSGAHGTTTI